MEDLHEEWKLEIGEKVRRRWTVLWNGGGKRESEKKVREGRKDVFVCVTVSKDCRITLKVPDAPDPIHTRIIVL